MVQRNTVDVTELEERRRQSRQHPRASPLTFTPASRDSVEQRMSRNPRECPA
jgi:hypothetical protein